MDSVKNGHTVSVHYNGTLENGEVFDSSREREPLTFKMGEGQMIPGFEQALLGMQTKEVKTVTLSPADAYGEVKSEMIQQVSKSQLPPDLVPHVGQQLASQLPDGQQMVVRVTDVAEDSITIDANHPLAGKELTFEIEVVSIS